MDTNALAIWLRSFRAHWELKIAYPVNESLQIHFVCRFCAKLFTSRGKILPFLDFILPTIIAVFSPKPMKLLHLLISPQL
jgi:hypothetical protein